jgi:hypothetical protein
MKKILLIGCLGVPVLVVLVGAIVAGTMDTKYDAHTAVVINAEPAKIYPYLNNLQKWQEWTVWNPENYPEMKYTYTGPEEGVGAKSSWEDPSGNGTMTITSSDPASGVDYDLQFAEYPVSKGILHMKKVDGGTEVEMALEGEMPFPANLLIPVIKPAMVEEFDKNLANLKKLAESQ